MTTRFHVDMLPISCTDAELRQMFSPFGTVVLAQVLRDPSGHPLGVGVVHMARPEEVENVFKAKQRFEVAGARVNIWEPL